MVRIHLIVFDITACSLASSRPLSSFRKVFEEWIFSSVYHVWSLWLSGTVSALWGRLRGWSWWCPQTSSSLSLWQMQWLCWRQARLLRWGRGQALVHPTSQQLSVLWVPEHRHLHVRPHWGSQTWLQMPCAECRMRSAGWTSPAWACPRHSCWFPLALWCGEFLKLERPSLSQGGHTPAQCHPISRSSLVSGRSPVF